MRKLLIALACIVAVAIAEPLAALDTLEIKDWVGQRFVLLPKPPKTRAYGYMLFDPHLPYAPWVGKTLTVIAVSEGAMTDIAFRADDGTVVHATVSGGQQVDNLAPLRDLDYARSKWRGKTLWLRGTDLITWNEATEKFGTIKVKKYAPVEVTDVVAGWFSQEPIHLILKAPSGETGFMDVNVSGTNVSRLLRELSHFDDLFFEKDPRLTFPWPKEVWEAIESEKVVVGMTVEQATMSRGKPKQINQIETSRGAEEQWVYRDGSFYVSNGKVTALQN